MNNVTIDASGGLTKKIPEWKADKQYIISFDYKTFGDDLILGNKKPKKHAAHDDDSTDSLDALADEEDELLLEDSFDDKDEW